MKFLNIDNAKTTKGEELGYYTGIMYLAPYTLSGVNLCPMAEIAQCHVACLNTAGRGRFTTTQQARIRKAKLFNEDRQKFMSHLELDIRRLRDYSIRNNKKPAIRLNGTSDIQWELISYVSDVAFGRKVDNVFQVFPDVQFYDYTKIPKRKHALMEPNYHLTWSFSNANVDYAKMRSEQHNWAVVFRCDMPEMFLGRPVIDGDKHDLRFKDIPECIVGLTPKGAAKRDVTGFVIDNPKEVERSLL